MTRWATFDCYGTLIDWNAGISAELARAFGLDVGNESGAEPEEPAAGEEADGPSAQADEEAPSEDELRLRELLERYHSLEAEVERDGSRSYREVMTEVMRRLGAPEAEAGGLAESLPRWPPFPEVPPTLAEVSERGWKLGILSNSDPDLIAASVRLLGVEVDEIVVASEVRAYKPSLRLWTEFYARTLADKRRHVHVGASIYHDIAPAVRLRLPTVWINRLDEHPGPSPTIELTDLEGLPDALDSLIAPD